MSLFSALFIVGINVIDTCITIWMYWQRARDPNPMLPFKRGIFFHRTAKMIMIGDKRAVVAEKGFGRPFKRVVFSGTGCVE